VLDQRQAPRLADLASEHQRIGLQTFGARRRNWKSAWMTSWRRSRRIITGQPARRCHGSRRGISQQGLSKAYRCSSGCSIKP
jgi:hypothetical protein